MSSLTVSQLSSPKIMEEGVPGHISENKTELNIHTLSSVLGKSPNQLIFFFQNTYPVITLDGSFNPKQR